MTRISPIFYFWVGRRLNQDLRDLRIGRIGGKDRFGVSYLKARCFFWTDNLLKLSAPNLFSELV